MSRTRLIFAAGAFAAAALAISLAAPGVARAESKLEVAVYTASPGGFLVDSTLVQGEKDAILVDAQFTLADAHRLAGMILDSKKNLTTVYVTHGHPDHYFGLAVIKQVFPKAKIVALPATIAEIKKTWKDKIKQWGPMYGANLPAQAVIPTELKGNTLTLEGQTLEVHGGVQGDEAGNSYVWIPSIKTAIVGDIVYRGVHAWTRETNADARKAWAKTIDDITALGPTTVVAGHKDPKLKDDPAGLADTKRYLATFDEAVSSSKTSAEAQQKVKAKFADLQLDVILQLGADAAFAPPAAAPAKPAGGAKPAASKPAGAPPARQ